MGRILLLAGAAAVAASVSLPWVTVEGRSIHLDLLGTTVSPGGKTVSGTDTSIWPIVLGVAGVVSTLALLNVARKLVLLLGFLITAAGAGLVYYATNVIDIETSGRTVIERALAGATLTSSLGAGPPVLVAGGLAILLGGLMR
jgi:hypothetical protein